VLETARRQSFALRERASDAVRDRSRILWICTYGSVPACLVERRMARGDDRGSAGHRLDHRDPEALEPRRVDDDSRTSVEPRQLLVGDTPEPDDVCLLYTF
jgi:hypothetical protein